VPSTIPDWPSGFSCVPFDVLIRGILSIVQEEKRAELERYRYDEVKVRQEMRELDSQIEARFQQVIAARAAAAAAAGGASAPPPQPVAPSR